MDAQRQRVVLLDAALLDDGGERSHVAAGQLGDVGPFRQCRRKEVTLDDHAAGRICPRGIICGVSVVKEPSIVSVIDRCCTKHITSAFAPRVRAAFPSTGVSAVACGAGGNSHREIVTTTSTLARYRMYIGGQWVDASSGDYF